MSILVVLPNYKYIKEVKMRTEVIAQLLSTIEEMKKLSRMILQHASDSLDRDKLTNNTKRSQDINKMILKIKSMEGVI